MTKIKEKSISLKVKKTMLDFLFNVYMYPPSTRLIDINDIDTLFRSVIVPDLARWDSGWIQEESNMIDNIFQSG